MEAPFLCAEFVAPALTLSIPEAWGNPLAAEMAVYSYYSGLCLDASASVVQTHGRVSEHCEHSGYINGSAGKIALFCVNTLASSPRTSDLCLAP